MTLFFFVGFSLVIRSINKKTKNKLEIIAEVNQRKINFKKWVTYFFVVDGVSSRDKYQLLKWFSERLQGVSIGVEYLDCENEIYLII